jgi:phosphonate transport system substrate-binding protein
MRRVMSRATDRKYSRHLVEVGGVDLHRHLVPAAWRCRPTKVKHCRCGHGSRPRSRSHWGAGHVHLQAQHAVVEHLLAGQAQALPGGIRLPHTMLDVSRSGRAGRPHQEAQEPGTLVFTYTPVEDPAVYEKSSSPSPTTWRQCTGKRVVFYQVQSNAAEIEAMRSGRLHVGGFSTGPTAFAVNIAGAVPFAIKGYEKDFQGYNLIVIVKKDSPFQKLSDLKGKKVAHTAPSSNSGHMAPMALFPRRAWRRRRTTRSCSRQARPVGAGRQQRRLRCGRGGLRRVPPDGHARPDQGSDFRVIYRSPKFPTSSFAYAHDLEPAARQDAQVLLRLPLPDEMKKAFDGADRFFPINYKEHWAVVRQVAEGRRREVQQRRLREGNQARGRRAQEGRRGQEVSVNRPRPRAAALS